MAGDNVRSWHIDYAAMPVPEHLRRHKEVFDRFMGGEMYTEIADSMNITPARVKQLYGRWANEVHRYMRKRTPPP